MILSNGSVIYLNQLVRGIWMNKFIVLQSLNDQPLFTHPGKVAAVAVAYQPSSIRQGDVVPVGSMLIFDGGTQFVVKGSPSEIIEQLFPTEH
jgi:hypothetical protein